MTISYAGNFWRTLLRWKGSIWKTIWRELLVFLALYYVVRIIYHFLLPEDAQSVLRELVDDFDKYTGKIPLNFLLGFYVQSVVKRWWDQFGFVVWPDDVITLVALKVQKICHMNMLMDDTDNPTTMVRRRQIARYLNLTAALTWRDISMKVKKRFPKIEHIVKSGLLTESELVLYNKAPQNIRWMLPIDWAQQLMKQHLAEHNVSVNTPSFTNWLGKLHSYRNGCRMLHCYDWICIPLVYTQVAAIATYGYFMLCLIGRQFEVPMWAMRANVWYEGQYNVTAGIHDVGAPPKFVCYKSCIDYVVPIFTILEFIFYVGWFKVGQDLMRPFGEDDDDIELNYLLDRHILVSAALVNPENTQCPNLQTPDIWSDNNVHVRDTIGSYSTQYHPPKLHTAKMYGKQQQEDIAEQPLLEKVINKPKRMEQTNFF